MPEIGLLVDAPDTMLHSESTADGATDNHLEILYSVDKTAGADFLKALGLENGASRYEKADSLDSTKFYYQSDVLIYSEEDQLSIPVRPPMPKR